MKEKLIRKVSHLKINDIQYILEELSKEENTDNTVEFKNETTKLTEEDVVVIRDTLTILIKEDNRFSQRLQEILEKDNRTRMADIFGPNETKVVIVGIIILGNILTNLIKAFKPAEEITKKGENIKEIRREYSSISDAVKPLATLLAKKKKISEE